MKETIKYLAVGNAQSLLVNNSNAFMNDDHSYLWFFAVYCSCSLLRSFRQSFTCSCQISQTLTHVCVLVKTVSWQINDASFLYTGKRW